jgi:hypothetical protein
VVYYGEFVAEMQLTGCPHASPVRPIALAFHSPYSLRQPIRQEQIHGRREIEPSVTVRVRTRELEKSPRWWMQHMRLGCGNVCRRTIEFQLKAKLLNLGEGCPQLWRSGPIAARLLDILLA